MTDTPTTLSVPEVRNVTRANPEHGCNAPLRDPTACTEDQDDLIIRKPEVRRPPSTRCPRMTLVLGGCAPFEVTQEIVGPNRVEVVHLTGPRRFRQEGFGDEPVDQEAALSRRGSGREIDKGISVRTDAGLQVVTDTGTATAPDAPDLAFIAYLVPPLVAAHGTPLFNHIPTVTEWLGGYYG